MQKLFCTVLSLFFLSAVLTSFSSTGKVELEIIGFESNQGKVHVNVFRGADGFPEDSIKAFKSFIFAIEDTIVRTGFDLPPGEYAIAVFHDENNNNEVDTNFLGIPKEPLGTSNNQKKGRPSYESSKFEVTTGVTVKLSIPISTIF